MQCDHACITRIPSCHSFTFRIFRHTLTLLLFKQPTFNHIVRTCVYHTHPSVSFLHFPYIQPYTHFPHIQTIYIQPYSAKMRVSHASLRVVPSLSSHMVPTRTLSTARYWILLNQNWNLWVWRAATKGLGARRRGTSRQNCCASKARFKCMRENILVHRMGSVCT